MDGPRTYLLKPERFERTNLVSSTAVEVYDLWTAGTYHLGNRVLRLATPTSGWMAGIPMLRIFEAQGTTNADPATGADWLDIGPCNQEAMFTGRLRETTTSSYPVGPGEPSPPSTLTVRVRAKYWCSAVYLGGLVATTATLKIMDQSEVVRSTHTRELLTRNPRDWDEFFTMDWERAEQAVFYPLTIAPNDIIELHLTGGAVIGRMLWGELADIGLAPIYGASVSVDDYTSDLADEFGRYESAKGSYATRQQLSCWHELDDGNMILRRLKELVGVPTVLIGNAGVEAYREPLINYGSVLEPSISIEVPTANTLTLEFKGYT